MQINGKKEELRLHHSPLTCALELLCLKSKIRDCLQSKESGTKMKIETLEDSNPWPSIHKVGMHSIH